MTPAAQQELDRHVQAIAKRLYADANISELKSLNDIEVTIRNQVQTHAKPTTGPQTPLKVANVDGGEGPGSDARR